MDDSLIQIDSVSYRELILFNKKSCLFHFFPFVIINFVGFTLELVSKI